MRHASFALAAILGAALAIPAQAQDVDWSGFYAGFGAGYSFTDSNAEFIDSGLSSIEIPSEIDGFLAGGQVGANVQLGVVVLGVEASASIANISSTFEDPLVPPETVTSTSDARAALLARAGVSLGTVLPYVTAGVAAARVTTSSTAGGADDEGIFTGLAYGAGIEVALDDSWSVRGQYLHTELGGDNFHEGEVYETSISPSSDTFTFAVNYRF